MLLTEYKIDDFGPPLTFRLAPQEGQNFHITSKMSKTHTGTEFLSRIHGQNKMTNKMVNIIPSKHRPCLHEHASMLPFSIQYSLAELPACLVTTSLTVWFIRLITQII